MVIDNYDSFVYNLVQYLGELGASPLVYRHDAIDVDGVRDLQPDAVLVSPGPRRPEDAGISNAVIHDCGSRGVPVLGVCLGLQCIGQVYGGEVVRAPRVMHGKTSVITHDGAGVFTGLPNPLQATRYHSLVVDARLRARRPRGERRERGRARDGPAPPARTRRGRAVPPRIDPHRVGARTPAELPRACRGRPGLGQGSRAVPCSTTARPSRRRDASASASSNAAGVGPARNLASTAPRR